MTAVRAALGSRYAGFAAVLLAGLAACQGVEFGVGVKPAAPPPDPVVVRQVEDARAAVAEAERKAKEAGQLAADAEAARAAAVATAADLEHRVAAGEATQEDLERARRRATEASAEATQAKERADRARAWTDEFAARVTAANDRLAKAEAAWRAAAGAGLDVQGPKDTSPWGLLSWAISTGLLVVLNEKRKREAQAVLEAAKRESGEVVARQDDAPFLGSGGKLEPEHRLADAPSRLDAIDAALAAAGVLKRGMSYDRGPRFAPAESDEPTRRIRRLEDWAGRHDQWATQTVVEGRDRVVHVEERVTVLEGKVVRLLASVGEHRLKWGIVAWVVGTAVAAGIALLAR